ncbi:MAG: outer membrane protein assembly factor BamD, partial [Pseudomonadota bacterium]|nr:outer membrane protein assembly factor BamD [Pseudomonadota bacterium]
MQTTTTTTTDSTGKPVESVTSTMTFHRGKKKTDAKTAKVVQSKDTKRFAKKDKTAAALVGVDAKLPDKQLYDKAVIAMNKGHYDVARLDLQTMLNTYPDSQYQMRAKLAIADSWFKEGGTAALTQAESEYADFRVFFPNVPETAEAQMRIGDIYFRQMDKPDRDYSKATHAEEEYRRMLTDYPNADPKLTTQAKQRLREVQEVMATREADIGSYYATRENWAAVIARYQTVVDLYPLYSHMDDTLIGLGDAYEAQARYIRGMKAPEAGKAKLEEMYDGLAAAQYRKVVLEHSAAPHVEDARDRLDAMHLPIPTPTPEQIAASVALENSRSSYTIANRARVLLMHVPDTVLAPKEGEPTLVDAKATFAPTIIKRVNGDFATAFAPSGKAPVVAPTVTAEAPATALAAPAAPAAPLAFNEVTGAAEGGGSMPSVMTATPAASGGSGNRMGVEILTPGA